jgi:hypothetical protein
MTGSEVYLNSGWLLPEGTRRRISWIFKYTRPYQKAGTHNYSLDAWISHRKIVAINRPADKLTLFFIV